MCFEGEEKIRVVEMKKNHEHNRNGIQKIYIHKFGSGRRASTDQEILFIFLYTLSLFTLPNFFSNLYAFPERKIILFIASFSVDKGIYKKVYYGWHWKYPDCGTTRKYDD